MPYKKLPESYYEKLSGDFHEKRLNSLNPVQRWFHNNRLKIVREAVEGFYLPGKTIVDLGCESCLWNINKLPVIGVDLNEKALRYGKSQGRLIDYIKGDIRKVPLRDEFADICIVSEVLEHIPDYQVVIKEINRILKPGGVCIASVPYDTLFSLWKPLFFIYCIIGGYVFGDPYLKNWMGHINAFSPSLLENSFKACGFRKLKLFHLKRLTIFLIAQKIRQV